MFRKGRSPSDAIFVFAFVGMICAASVSADWVPSNGHKMHFPQLPNEIGWDVNATAPVVLAEDFRCAETGWIKDIHFWGSWKNGVQGQIQYFILSLHKDIPVGPSVPYSRPGELLWERRITNFLIKQIDPPTSEGWYDPSTGEVLPNNHQQYFQYNVFLDQADWFPQEAGTIYWLNISAVLQPDPVPKQWGWKSTRDHWNDDAVWGTTSLCISPDNGTGTADQPSMCTYLPTNEVMRISDGLPAGTTIEIQTELIPLSLTGESPGGNLGGTRSQSHMQYKWHMMGTGTLAGYTRDILMDLPICQTDQGPRNPGTSPQSFPTDFFTQQGQLPPGDPDFDLLRITAGSGFGMPSPGHTTLTSMGGGNWNIESFFDITYRIDFVGSPGSPLAGMSGSTTGTIRLSQGNSTPASWTDMYEPQVFLTPIQNDWDVVFDENSIFGGGSGTDAYGDGWYRYPSQWWNIWFYDHQLDSSRYKEIHVEFDILPFNPGFPTSSVIFAINWARDYWSVDGNPLPQPRIPPLPGTDEAQFIARDIRGTLLPGHYSFDLTVPEYNPEWVSIDLLEPRNVRIRGFIIHDCRPKPPQSLDLSFVITGGGQAPTGACCYPNTFGSFDCTVTTQDNCVNNLNGVYQGDNSACGGIQACCLPNGNCVNVDVICCQSMGGTPQGAGSLCSSAPQACCLSNGQCAMLDPLCCVALGGQPQPVGSSCSAPQACCLSNGQCAMLDPLCCAAMGGQPQPVGLSCSTIGACCLPSGLCVDVDPVCCRAMGGDPQPPGTSCATVICGGDVEACCLANGACVMLTPTLCTAQGGTPQGAGTACTAPEACCLPNGQCADLDPLCCLNAGGHPQGPGTKCTFPRVCCLPNGQCIFIDPLCCDDLQGIPKGTTASCTAVPSPCCCIGLTGNVDCDPANGTDISDLSALIDNLYITFSPLCCPDAANTDGQSGVDISDLSALIDYLYISFTPTSPCP